MHRGPEKLGTILARHPRLGALLAPLGSVPSDLPQTQLKLFEPRPGAPTERTAMPGELYEGIVEVVECRPKKANALLEHGYRLLAVLPNAVWTDQKEGPGYVYRGILYVIGRPNGVRPFDPDKAAA